MILNYKNKDNKADDYEKINTLFEIFIGHIDDIKSFSLKDKQGNELYNDKDRFLENITTDGNSDIIKQSKKIDTIYEHEYYHCGYNEKSTTEYMLFTLKNDLKLDITQIFDDNTGIYYRQTTEDSTINLNTSDIYVLQMPVNVNDIYSNPYYSGAPFFLSRIKDSK
jgi:hypothetical protein